MVFSQPAMTLLNAAQAYAQSRRDPTLDVLHIMHVALERPELSGGAYEIVSSIDPAKRGQWLHFIAYDLDMHPRDIAPVGPYSQRLVTCMQQWSYRADSISGYVGVTCSLMLATILNAEPSLARMAQYCEINAPQLVQLLEARVPYAEGSAIVGGGAVGIPGGYAPNTGYGVLGGQGDRWPHALGYGDVVPSQVAPLAPPPMASAQVPPMLPATPGFGGITFDPRTLSTPLPVVGDGKLPGQGPLARFADLVQPTSTRVFARVHTDVFLRLNPYLSEQARARGMYILAGHCGTPIQVVGQVLADRLPFSARPASVRAIHLSQLLGEISRDATAAEYLPRMLREATGQSTVLVLDELEALRGDGVESGVRDQIVEELGNAAGVPIIGLYQLAEHETYDPDQVRLGIASATTWAVEPSSEVETLALLRDTFLRDWQAQGFTFKEKEKTFEWVFKLAPYLRLESRRPGELHAERKRLPYAVLDVGRELIATLSTAPAQQPGYAQQAGYASTFERDYESARFKSTIHELAAVADKQILHYSAVEQMLPADIRDVMHKADEEIRKLAKDPSPHFKTRTPPTQIELTRGHLMAQIFYPAGTHFQPVARLAEGVTPFGARENTLNGMLP